MIDILRSLWINGNMHMCSASNHDTLMGN